MSQFLGAFLLPIAASVVPVEAGCDSSQIQIAAPSSIFDRTIPVTWRVDPACNPIETGVSVSEAEGRFDSAGTPMYGGRAVYADEIPVSVTGLYWLGAYAIDEQGGIAHSAPRAVLVLVPIVAPADPGASLPAGASIAASADLSAYTGTDADFLQAVGNVHVASIKSEHWLDQGVSHSFQGGGVDVVFMVGGVSEASTARNEVAGSLDTPLTVEGESFVWDPATVQSSPCPSGCLDATPCRLSTGRSS